MAALNSGLKEYLSSSHSSDGSLSGKSYSEQFSKLLPSFSKSSELSTSVDDSESQWMGEAKKDPCLPTLVRHIYALHYNLKPYTYFFIKVAMYTLVKIV